VGISGSSYNLSPSARNAFVGHGDAVTVAAAATSTAMGPTPVRTGSNGYQLTPVAQNNGAVGASKTGAAHGVTHELVPIGLLQSSVVPGERSGASSTASAAPISTSIVGCTLAKTEMELVLRRLRRIVREVGAECARRTDGQQEPSHALNDPSDEQHHKVLLIRTLYECDAFAGTEVGRQLEQTSDGVGSVELLRSYAERKGWYSRTVAM
jgi:hypothetical protein